MKDKDEIELFYKLKGKHRGGSLTKWTIQEPFVFGYTLNNGWHADGSLLRSAPIVEIVETDGRLIVETLNAYIYLEGPEDTVPFEEEKANWIIGHTKRDLI